MTYRSRGFSNTRLMNIVKELQGSCRSLDNVLYKSEMENVALIQAIEQEIFKCSCCDWWCEVSEECVYCADANDEQTCSDCCEGKHDEED